MLHQNLFSMINIVENLVIHFYSLLGNLGFNSREKLNFRQQNTSINGCWITHKNSLPIQITLFFSFTHSVIQKLNVNNQTNIAMRKVASKQLTAVMFSGNFIEKDKEFVASDQAFAFMNYIEGIPACWKKILFVALAFFYDTFIRRFEME